jgi:hypothetical protein
MGKELIYDELKYQHSHPLSPELPQLILQLRRLNNGLMS